MPPTPRPLRIALVLLLPALVALAGCSTPDPGAAGAPANATSLPKFYDAKALLDAVGDRERADGGALTVLNGTLDPPGTGTVEAGAPTPPGRRAVTGDGVLRFADGAVSTRFDQRLGPAGAAPRTTGAVRTAGRTWLRLPGAPGWSEVGRAQVAQPDLADATLATNIAGMADPLAGVTRYADAALVAEAQDESLGDVATVRYTIVVDLVRAAAAETDPTLRAQLTQQVAGGLTRISSTVWVDRDQRPVRGRLRQELPGAGTLDLVTDYRSWGTPVTVAPPT
ncbi:hypothetical protein [Pseudonocardia endophytica]|uniref:Lipoprotein LprG n=1 Tax=Pseudonocardia endophytica TaxID=401976 RepID=A0A4R1HI30_PSEEN|nr:hypothetical protein [Pseudonocardia endophytica]TCK20581.1 hypothetical protein EV378_4542 [Pseudonocardia endophytica]